MELRKLLINIENVTQLASAETKISAGAISNDPASKIDVNKSIYASDTQGDFANALNAGEWKSGSVESQTVTLKVQIRLIYH